MIGFLTYTCFVCKFINFSIVKSYLDIGVAGMHHNFSFEKLMEVFFFFFPQLMAFHLAVEILGTK